MVEEHASSPPPTPAHDRDEPAVPPGAIERSPVLGPLVVFVVGFLLILPLILDTSPGGSVFGKYSARMALLVFGLLALDVVIAALLAWRTVVWNRKREDRSPCRKLLFYFVIILVFAVAVEIGFRWMADTFFNPHDLLAKYGNTTSPYLYYEEKANAEWKIAGATYHTDGHGFRKGVSEAAAEKRPGVARVAAVGGSSVFGYGLEDDGQWPALLLRKLNAGGRKWEVINAGNNGYNSFQVFLKAYKRVLPLSPDVVLYYENFNDKLQSVLDFNRTFSYEYFYFQKWSRYIGKAYPQRCWYMRHLVTAHFTNYLLDRIFRISRDPPGIGSDETDFQYRTNVGLLSDLCRRRGARLVLVTFIHGYEPEAYDARSVERRNEALREIARTEGLGLVDCAAAAAVLDNRKELTLADGYHPSPEGARLISRMVAEYLAPLHGELVSKKPSD